MRKLYLFAGFLVVYEFTTYIANDMIMPGMLHVLSEFNAPISYVALSFTFYILGNSILQLFVGPLSEHFGKRKVILAGNLFFIIITILITLSHNAREFMLGRLIQGGGLSFIAIGYALIHEKFSDKDAVKLFALMANISIMAPLIGPVLGSIVMKVFNWRVIFIIITLLAMVSLIGLYRFIPKDHDSKKNSLSISMAFKMYLRIVQIRQFILGAICVALASLPVMCWIALSPNVIMRSEGLSMFDYGICQLFAIGGIMISSILMQFIAGRFSFYKIINATCAIAFIGAFIGVLFHNNLPMVVFSMFLYSLGLGIFNNLIMRLIMTTPNFPQAMISSLMILIIALINAGGMEVVNLICENFAYSLTSFTVCNFIISIFVVGIVTFYMKAYKNKGWD